MYCDMTTGTSIYLWNGTPPRRPGATVDEVVSLDGIRAACARVGLEPMVLKSPQHFKSIHAALSQMGEQFVSALTPSCGQDDRRNTRT